MKNITTLIALLFLSFTGFAQSGPKIDIQQPENTVDYGKVNKSSDNGIRNFTFTNSGDAPLSITGDKIEVKYNMVPGPIRKTITLETNAVNYADGRVPLKIKGEVLTN